MRTSVLFDDELAAEARELGINVSEAAREGLRQAVRRRRAERDRAAYLAQPETEEAEWDEAESWGEACGSADRSAQLLVVDAGVTRLVDEFPTGDDEPVVDNGISQRANHRQAALE